MVICRLRKFPKTDYTEYWRPVVSTGARRGAIWGSSHPPRIWNNVICSPSALASSTLLTRQKFGKIFVWAFGTSNKVHFLSIHAVFPTLEKLLRAPMDMWTIESRLRRLPKAAFIGYQPNTRNGCIDRSGGSTLDNCLYIIILQTKALRLICISGDAIKITRQKETKL